MATRYGTLTFEELRAQNARRCETHYHPIGDWSLTDWMTAVTGEAGELAGVIKNIRRREVERTANGHSIPHETLVKFGDEAADVVIYLDLLCARAGVDLGDVVARKFNEVSTERLGCDIDLPRKARCICGPSWPAKQPDGSPWPHTPECPVVLVQEGPPPWVTL